MGFCGPLVHRCKLVAAAATGLQFDFGGRGWGGVLVIWLQRRAVSVLALASNGVEKLLGRPPHLVSQVRFRIADSSPSAAAWSDRLASRGNIGRRRSVMGYLGLGLPMGGGRGTWRR